ncbi:hypothetical protein [Achromobacter ruhlandii]|uniref:hypothetical protein n=1 Tax=Achromobacter ruhlandii TaxID=72557 RepID=UPI000B267F8A|nr:hypothetical protein [Achromobacter ruhlandii]
MSQQRNALAGVLGGAFNDQGRLQPGALGRIAQAAPDYAPQYAQLANTQQRLDRQDRMTDTSVAMKKQEWAQQGFAVSNTPQEAAAYIQNGVQSGILTPEEGQRGLAQIPQDPAAYTQWRNQINQSMMTAAQRAELEKGNYSAPAQSSQGFFQADRSGNVRLLKGPDGKPLMPVTLDAMGQAAVAGAKTTATKEAENAVAKPGKAIEAKAALDSTSSSLDRTIELANGIMNDPALGRITGIMGMIPNRPGGDAANAQARLNTLKSQIGFAVLQAMRDASKTGGALGAVSDAENKLLQNNIASLENVQDEAQLRQELQKIIAWATGAKGRMTDAYAQQYGNVMPQPAQQTGMQGAAGGVLSAPARTVVRTGTANGRKVVQYSDGTLDYAD